MEKSIRLVVNYFHKSNTFRTNVSSHGIGSLIQKVIRKLILYEKHDDSAMQ